MRSCRSLLLFICIFSFVSNAIGQRVYRPTSMLSSGTWYKISVSGPGVYKIDLPFLQSQGISTQGLTSSSIRLFGNGGHMLPEDNMSARTDDLHENPLFIADGGDGVMNGTDHILFYAPGPDEWIKDSVNQKFRHRRNLYSNNSYYYLNIGGTGKRIQNSTFAGVPNITVTSFNERLFHELDSVNFLQSGKEWYGEEFADMPGRLLSRNFSFNVPGVQSPISVSASLVARSVGVNSNFNVFINDVPSGQASIPPVSGSNLDMFAQEISHNFLAPSSSTTLNIRFQYLPGSFNSQGWLNRFEISAKRNLQMINSGQLHFRDWSSVGTGNVAEFRIGLASANNMVWDITDPLEPVMMNTTINGQELRFINDAGRLREYIAFSGSNLLLPKAIGRIPIQDLHLSTPVDYLIITTPLLQTQAARLADFHQQTNNLRSLVVTTEKIFNEFSSGSPDPVAIRDFLKMYHDKYAGNLTDKLKYVLFFGDASYDYKNRIANNTNIVPGWQNGFSLDPLATFTSDDFFGFLDDHEDANSFLIINQLDIGIGRIPAKNLDEAKNVVDKIESYYAPSALGPWRTNISFIADDEDNNLHLNDAEILTATAATQLPSFNIKKIYLDSYRQESGAGGSTYPGAVQASNSQVYNGTLIWNYNGHGGPRRLAQETILDQEMVNRWDNSKKLPLMITATCDFAPYDNPSQVSLGENLLLRKNTGAIALMTTTRTVFAFSNRLMNDNYLRIALQPDINGKFKTLGEAMMEAKNYTYQTSGDVPNNRKFTLLGDPALKLAFPQQQVKITLVNGMPAQQADTLSALENVVIEGEITDRLGNLVTGFNGFVYPSIFDKPQNISTLANDPTSQVTLFQVQNNLLFKGKASVTAGRFSFSFKVPKDINYQFGNGKMLLYAENGSEDANGMFNNFIVGGGTSTSSGDLEGPQIKLTLNDDKFVDGSITNEQPLLIAYLSDSSGINTAGTGIGHDIVATLDNDNNRFFILNDFYQSEPDNYKAGIVKFQLPGLEPGMHTIKFKAWDVANNSREVTINFTVVNNEELKVDHVLNYPNPFTTRTSFWFEHNQPGRDLKVTLQIMTITGKIVKKENRIINTEGFRSSEIEWDGRDEFGQKLGRGVYLYRLRVEAPDGKSKTIRNKLVLL